MEILNLPKVQRPAERRTLQAMVVEAGDALQMRVMIWSALCGNA